MSWLRVVHETIYRYAEPVRFGPHRLVLRPREGHDLRVQEMVLQIEPEGQVEWARDIFGNSVATVHFSKPSDTLHIINRLLLYQTSAFPRRSARPDDPPRYPLTFSAMEETVTAAYRVLIYPEDEERATRWLRAKIDVTGFSDAEALAAAVNDLVRQRLRYRRREEKGVQTPAQTIETESGSCRDLATLLMECWRTLGFPARFASGYLDCQASEAGRASTHAWAEVYLPEVGWIGFDPTLGTLTSSQHVVTGVSHHPRGVMPIVGTFFGYSSLYRGMEVKVKTERVANPLAAHAS